MVIKGTTVITLDKLKALLLFGDNPSLFEKEIIRGFHDDYIDGDTYNFYREEVEVLTQESIGDGEYNTLKAITAYPKNELIEYAIDVETYRSIAFLESNYNKNYDYSHHQWLFARILKCYLSSFNVGIIDYPYRDYYIEYFSEIVKKSLLLYRGIFDNQLNIREVNIRLKSQLQNNKTGYKLKQFIYKTKIRRFTECLVSKGYINSKDCDRFKQFLLGEYPQVEEYPHEKIEWLKELRYLVYFITKLNEKIEKKDKMGKYLLSPPGHKWKNLSAIFQHNQSSLPEKFYETYSKLGRKGQTEVNSIIDLLNP